MIGLEPELGRKCVWGRVRFFTMLFWIDPALYRVFL